MGIFETLFGSKNLKTTDPDFGEIESFSTQGERVGWQIKRMFLGSDIEILIEGDKEGISTSQKQIILHAIYNETEIKSESEKALMEQFSNAGMEFTSIEKHFYVRGISVRDDGFEIAFQEKEGEHSFFNVQFENNKQVGVSIDG